jgi:hypothetical protein
MLHDARLDGVRFGDVGRLDARRTGIKGVGGPVTSTVCLVIFPKAGSGWA